MRSALAGEHCIGALKSMGYNEPDTEPAKPAPRTRLPLSRSRQRLSYERRIRVFLYLMGLPALLLVAIELYQQHVEPSIQWIALSFVVVGWILAVSLLLEQITRPLQTLANVVAALREDDYSFRARGGRRNDAVGDLALEINALAGMLQVQRVGAMEAMALVERVMKSMQSPVLAFDPEGRLKLLNAAAERAFHLREDATKGRTAMLPNDTSKVDLERLLRAEDNDLLTLSHAENSARWVVKRTSFRLRGAPHALFVLSDVSEALREEERLAWERLIRVLGHEINNSLTPIKSIAGSLRSRLAAKSDSSEDAEDLVRGLEVIEDRAESLNRFLQAYRELIGLPAPKPAQISLASLIRRVAQLETRIHVKVTGVGDTMIDVDPDQLAQALINLVRNATEAALSPDAGYALEAIGEEFRLPQVEICWEITEQEISIFILDNGPGLANASNLFVPFYTTKPNGTGIGLVLAQQIAQAHSGLVLLANRTDCCGCRASLRLPIASRLGQGKTSGR